MRRGCLDAARIAAADARFLAVFALPAVLPGEWKALLPDWTDEARRISSARTSHEEFEQQFQKDQEEFVQQVGHGWRSADLR